MRQHHCSTCMISSFGHALFKQKRMPGSIELSVFFQFVLSLHGYGRFKRPLCIVHWQRITPFGILVFRNRFQERIKYVSTIYRNTVHRKIDNVFLTSDHLPLHVLGSVQFKVQPSQQFLLFPHLVHLLKCVCRTYITHINNNKITLPYSNYNNQILCDYIDITTGMTWS